MSLINIKSKYIINQINDNLRINIFLNIIVIINHFNKN